MANMCENSLKSIYLCIFF